MGKKCGICGSTEFEQKGDKLVCKICGEEFKGDVSHTEFTDDVDLKKKHSVLETGRFLFEIFNIKLIKGKEGQRLYLSYRSLIEEELKSVVFVLGLGRDDNDDIRLRDSDSIKDDCFYKDVQWEPVWENVNREISNFEIKVRRIEVTFLDDTKEIIENGKIFISSEGPNLELNCNSSMTANCYTIKCVSDEAKLWFTDHYVATCCQCCIKKINYEDITNITMKYPKYKNFDIQEFIISDGKTDISFTYVVTKMFFTDICKDLASRLKIVGNTKYLYKEYTMKGDVRKIDLNTAGRYCYIATCVYGSYDCPEVWTLRRYRDYKLAETWNGRLFIKMYYAISPTIVKWFGNKFWFKKIWKNKLDKMVKNLQKQGFENTPYDDIKR